MNLAFLVAYAWRSLRRDGQHSGLAVGCVAFGVLSLVGLQQLSHIVAGALLVPPRFTEGGDLILTRPAGIEPGDLAALPGVSTPIAPTRAIFLKSAASGRTTLVSRAVGVDPHTYPLYGSFTLRDGSLRDALARTGDALVTVDLADRFDLDVGDRFYLFGAPNAAPIPLRVGGLAERTPDRQGMGVYFSLDTARALGLGRATQVLVRHADPGAIAPELTGLGWTARVVPRVGGGEEVDLFGFMLGGAGILGLLLGGIGVANTMQVLLARRRHEIATLKALGYRRMHLVGLFGVESLLLACIGCTLGVGGGLLLANQLMGLLSGNMSYLLSYSIDAATVVGGFAVGVATTLVFSMVAILKASEVRPAILLRDSVGPVAGQRRGVSWGLYAALIAAFGILSSIVLGSPIKGFGVVLGGLLALGLLALGLAGVLHLVTRIPTRNLPMLLLARRNLRDRPMRAIYGLVALFVGVVAIGFATVALHNADLRFESRRIDLVGINLRVYADSQQWPHLEDALGESGAQAWFPDFYLPAQVLAAGDSLLGLTEVVGRPEGRMRWNLSLTDSTTGSDGGAYLADTVATQHGLVAGDTLTVRTHKGAVSLALAGIFSAEGTFLDFSTPPKTVVVPLSVVRSLGPERLPLQVHIAADPSRLTAVSETLGREVPNGVVLGKDTVAEVINRLFQSLYWFVVAIAGLALVAGVVLIANSVGLSMLERKRELGVFKALGYSSRQVLTTVLLENALAGLIGGGAGVLALALCIPVLNALASAAELSLGVGQAALLLLVAVACSMGAALVVAWRPTRVRPLQVLREG